MSVKSFIDGYWQTRAELAADVGVSTDTVHKWAQTGSIPAKYHLGVLRSAQRRGADVSALTLIELHAREQQVGAA